MRSVPAIAREMPPEELKEFLDNMHTGFSRAGLQFLYGLRNFLNCRNLVFNLP